MAWVLPPTAVTGNVIPASWGNDVLGDLTALQSSLQFVNQGGGISGSPPATNTPAYQVQAGVAIGTTTSGGAFTVTFNVPFPNGLIAAWAINYGTTNHFWVELSGSPTRTGASFTCLTSNSSVLNTGAYDVPWIALGF